MNNKNKIAHMQFIQDVIKRLAKNSFLLKGWSVTLVSALFVLATKDRLIFFALLAYLPAIAFWALDGYFLRQERLFRALYNKVRIIEDERIDFSMDTRSVENSVDTWWNTCFSATLSLFHGTVCVTIFIIMICLKFFNC